MLAREGVKGASLYPALTMDTDYSISYNNCWLSKWAQKKVDGGKGELAEWCLTQEHIIPL